MVEIWLFCGKTLTGNKFGHDFVNLSHVKLFKNFKINVFPLSLFSDCEVCDVTGLAQDEELADKLFKETLRVLKIESFNHP